MYKYLNESKTPPGMVMSNWHWIIASLHTEQMEMAGEAFLTNLTWRPN